MPTAAPVRWLDGSGDSYTNGETLTMWQNVTLYAQWISTETYTLTYDANGGVGTMESQSGTMLDSLIVAANGFTKDGYAFTGWNTAADGTGTAYAPTDGITLNANTTLYAQWQPGFVGSFDTDSGVAGIDVYYTKDYTTPDETNATETYVRDSDTGALDAGQRHLPHHEDHRKPDRYGYNGSGGGLYCDLLGSERAPGCSPDDFQYRHGHHPSHRRGPRGLHLPGLGNRDL